MGIGGVCSSAIAAFFVVMNLPFSMPMVSWMNAISQMILDHLQSLRRLLCCCDTGD
jgi:hypothetical protein